MQCHLETHWKCKLWGSPADPLIRKLRGWAQQSVWISLQVNLMQPNLGTTGVWKEHQALAGRWWTGEGGVR